LRPERTALATNAVTARGEVPGGYGPLAGRRVHIVGWGLRGKVQGALERTIDAVAPEPLAIATSAMRRHKTALGVYPNLLCPRTFNEKVLHRMLFDRRPILRTVEDKYTARDYVKRRIGQHVLPRLYWVTKQAADIPFHTLPDRYVVKATHGCGWNYFVRGDAAVDRQDLIRTCTTWLKSSYYTRTREWAYKHMEPRIIVEEFISDGTGVAPTDYKFYVFDGRVHMIEVDRGRFVDQGRANYGRSWDRWDMVTQFKPLGDVARPPHLDEMIHCAEVLGTGLDYVRVDLYDAGKVYFGEMCVYPGGGTETFLPATWDRYLGGLWDLSPRPACFATSNMRPRAQRE
jgi:TupA-like ATPgrasp